LRRLEEADLIEHAERGKWSGSGRRRARRPAVAAGADGPLARAFERSAYTAKYSADGRVRILKRRRRRERPRAYSLAQAGSHVSLHRAPGRVGARRQRGLSRAWFHEGNVKCAAARVRMTPERLKPLIDRSPRLTRTLR
jgi:hypothetical protein